MPSRSWGAVQPLRRRAGVEREDGEGTNQQDECACCEEDDLQSNAQAVLLSVVIDDDADAVSTVQHSQPEQQQIPDLPEGLAHLPPTKPKSMAWIPSPTMRLENR